MGRVIAGTDIGAFYSCGECGKTFYARFPGQWAYKAYTGQGAHYFCSYSCSQKWKAAKAERDKEELGNKRVRGLQDVITAEVLDDLFWNQGLTLGEIAKKLNVSRATIDKYMDIYAISYNSNGRVRAPKRMPRGIRNG